VKEESILMFVVIRVCTECNGEGVIWGWDGIEQWCERCKFCNCCGVIYDLPDSWKRVPENPDEVDQDDVPF